jgi:hypothetical protein
LQEIPISQYVACHTIAGQKSDDVESDGIVPHSSSHLEGAASEKIVPAGHSAHYHPLAILEVRRILQEHLKNSSVAASSGRTGDSVP